MQREASYNWFLKLRWFAFIAQTLLLIIAVYFFELTLPVNNIILILCLIPSAGLILRYKFFNKFLDQKIIGFLLAYDTIVLTCLFNQTGGPTNPFTIVYLLHVVLAAVILNAQWTWIISLLSTCGFISLFFNHLPVPELQHHHASHGFSIHLHGMLFSYVLVAIITTYFLNKILFALRQKEAKLINLQHHALNNSRMSILASVSAGAAHELGTPLSTILLIADELAADLLELNLPEELKKDFAILRSEALRCKKIIRNMCEKVGDFQAEKLETVYLKDLVLEAIRLNSNQTVVFETSISDQLIINNLPRRAMLISLNSIFKNAIEALQTKSEKIIKIDANLEGDFVKVIIKDQGSGVDPSLIDNLGQPFISTKSASGGMGLGLYLVRLTLDRIGGVISFSSNLNEGTEVSLKIPLNCAEI